MFHQDQYTEIIGTCTVGLPCLLMGLQTPFRRGAKELAGTSGPGCWAEHVRLLRGSHIAGRTTTARIATGKTATTKPCVPS